MSKLISLALSVLLCFSFNLAAQEEVWSCEELTTLADDLDMIAEAFEQAGTIEEDDEIDQALGVIVDAITVIAEVEAEPKLTRAVNSLISAYNNMDGERFALALDSVIANLDRLYRRDCA